MDVKISPESVKEVNEKIQELKAVLAKNKSIIVFSTTALQGYLFPDTYKVCANDDPESETVLDKDKPTADDGAYIDIGDCLAMYDYNYHDIIPAAE